MDLTIGKLMWIRQRNQANQKIIRIQRTLMDNADISLAQLNVLNKNLASIYTEFCGFHSKALALIPDEAVDEQENVYVHFETIYNNCSHAVEELLLEEKTEQTQLKQQVIIQQQPLKAPIPTFDGSYSAWPKFKAIFLDLMANSGDTDAIKLYHLDKALVGEAADVLDARIVSEGNYQQAWEILIERYENKRVIVETHIRGLLSLKRMATESYKELRTLLNEINCHVEGLKFQKEEIIGVSEHMIVYLITSALDKTSRKAWEATQKKGDLPKYETTIAFLKTRCAILENCEAALQEKNSFMKPKLPTSIKLPPQRSHAVSTTEIQPIVITCEICGGSHRNVQCSTLQNLTAAQKQEKVKAAGVCFNCLRKGHRSKDCPSKKLCQKCQRRHHTLLHENVISEQQIKSNLSAIPEKIDVSLEEPHQSTAMYKPSILAEPPVSTSCSSHAIQSSKTVLLLTAIVQAFDRNNQPHPCRVLLDSGSQINFISENMSNRLGLPKQPANVPIIGINALRSHAREKVTVKFKSRVTNFVASIECLVTPKVTGPIPTSKYNTE